jgi:hypothetical protein
MSPSGPSPTLRPVHFVVAMGSKTDVVTPRYVQPGPLARAIVFNRVMSRRRNAASISHSAMYEFRAFIEVDLAAGYWSNLLAGNDLLTPDSRPFDPEKFIKRLPPRSIPSSTFDILCQLFARSRQRRRTNSDSSDGDKLSQVGPEVI